MVSKILHLFIFLIFIIVWDNIFQKFTAYYEVVVYKTINHKSYFSQAFQESFLGFPGGAVVENLPANAGDTGSSPGLGRSHMPWSNWAREPQLLSLHVWSLCSATREAATVRGLRTAMKSGPRLPQLEKALAQKQRPNTPKNKFKKNPIKLK